MLSKFSDWLNARAKGWLTLTIFTVFIIFMVFTLQGANAGLDTHFFYTPEEAYSNSLGFRRLHCPADGSALALVRGKYVAITGRGVPLWFWNREMTCGSIGFSTT